MASPGRRPFGDVKTDATTLRVFAAGDIADCRHQAPEQAAAHFTAALIPPGATVLALGDVAYESATSATLQGCFEPTWGSHKTKTLLVAGNHDYVGGSTQAVRDYFALDPAVDGRFVAYVKWLSPAWLVVVLDSNVRGATLDAEYEWLQQTLQRELGQPAATTEPGASVQPGRVALPPRANAPQAAGRCLMALWHAPLFSSGLHHGSGIRMQRFWSLLDSYGGDLVLNGHEHFYEAFEPLDSAGVPRTEGAGMRQFVVGTGGAPLYGFWRPPFSSRARLLEHGVLALDLSPGSYAWSVVGTDGEARDWGSARCRHAGAPPTHAALGTKTAGTAQLPRGS
jgi:hypothetical protein